MLYFFIFMSARQYSIESWEFPFIVLLYIFCYFFSITSVISTDTQQKKLNNKISSITFFSLIFDLFTIYPSFVVLVLNSSWARQSIILVIFTGNWYTSKAEKELFRLSIIYRFWFENNSSTKRGVKKGWECLRPWS